MNHLLRKWYDEYIIFKSRMNHLLRKWYDEYIIFKSRMNHLNINGMMNI